tara:strand:+ start:90 stop:539 length:450 start_codon:yes stop_codon:yes gene_type:complete
MTKSLKNLIAFSLGALYIIVGIKHFTDLEFFLVIVPPYIPFPETMVYISGLFEIIFGCLLIPKKTRKYAAIGLIFLLIAVFPANIFLFNSEVALKTIGITSHDALVRLPFQIPLIIIAYWQTKNNTSKEFDLIAIILFIPTILYFLTLG